LPDEKTAPAEAFRTTLTGMGAQGDALGQGSNGPVFVAFALPGESVIAVPKRSTGQAIWAEPWRILEPSPERIEPACAHFGTCGGCKLQHWRDDAYRAWKSSLVGEALGRHGLAPPVDFAIEFIPEHSRRRIELAAIGRQGSAILGFHEMASDRVVDVRECPVLEPVLAALLEPLRVCLGSCLGAGERCDILVTMSDSGADLLVSAARPPSEHHRGALVGLARAGGIARISWRANEGVPDIICQLDLPKVSFDGVAVELPVPSFLQPTQAGEALLRARVSGLVPKARRVAELHCGCGTFTFALARAAPVHALDGAKAAIEALRAATRRAGLQQRIDTEVRDLERSPLSLQELRRYDTVVMDPPRSGARRQVAILARSDVRTIVYVSCNPGSFARDARALADGGFDLISLMALDQFRWSAHLELVGEFSKRRSP
jgi:23S rRNA (uracil1939-C5)-methyltransferase